MNEPKVAAKKNHAESLESAVCQLRKAVDTVDSFIAELTRGSEEVRAGTDPSIKESAFYHDILCRSPDRIIEQAERIHMCVAQLRGILGMG